jgi:hypothetical protein
MRDFIPTTPLTPQLRFGFLLPWLLLVLIVAVAASAYWVQTRNAARLRESQVTAEIRALIPKLKQRRWVSPPNPLPEVVAARRLAEIGAPAVDALPALAEMAKSKDPGISDPAKDAIEKIKGRAGELPARKH